MFRKLILLIYIPGILFASELFAQTAVFKGYVKDINTGKPIPGATVVVELADHTKKETNTNRRGQFEITNLKDGVYYITVTILGFETGKVTDLKISDGRTTFYDFLMNSVNYLEKYRLGKLNDYMEGLKYYSSPKSQLNKTDSLGRKQGHWQHYFEDVSDTSGWKLGQVMNEGFFLNDKKDGPWTYYNKDGVTKEKVEFYQYGKLMESLK